MFRYPMAYQFLYVPRPQRPHKKINHILDNVWLPCLFLRVANNKLEQGITKLALLFSHNIFKGSNETQGQGDLGHGTALFLLIALTLFAGILRFYLLGQKSLFLDEGWMVEFGHVPFQDVLSGKSTAVAEAVFPYMLVAFGDVFGYSEFSIRLLPAIAGTLLIPSSYFLARLYLARWQSLLVAALVVISPIVIAYSQEAANYSLGMLLATVYLRCFILFLRTGDKRLLLYFVAIATLSVYLHLYHLFIVSTLVASCAFQKERYKSCSAALIAIATVITLSLPAMFLDYRILVAMEHHYSASDLALSFEKIYGFIKVIVFSWLHGPLDSIYIPQSSFLSKSPLSLIVFLGQPLSVVILFSIFAWVVGYNLVRADKDIAVLLIIIAVYCTAAVYFATKVNHLYGRYFLVLLPLFYILLVRSFTHPWRSRLAGWLSFGMISLLIVHFVVTWGQNYDKKLWKSDWKTTIQLLRKSIGELGPGQNFAILVPVNYESTITQFYLPDLRDRTLWDDEFQAYTYNPQLAFLKPGAVKQYNLKLLSSPLASKSEVIYVLTERGRDQIPYITEKLSDHFRPAEVSEGNARLYTFKRYDSSKASGVNPERAPK